jgi:hypothetical protein
MNYASRDGKMMKKLLFRDPSFITGSLSEIVQSPLVPFLSLRRWSRTIGITPGTILLFPPKGFLVMKVSIYICGRRMD